MAKIPPKDIHQIVLLEPIHVGSFHPREGLVDCSVDCHMQHAMDDEEGL